MAYELVEEVFEHAPPMTAVERLILLAIAEQSRVADRMRMIDGDEMMRRSCVETARGLAHALARLAERGLEVRVPLGRDKRGAPVYAVTGQARLFKLPHLKPAPADCRCRMCRLADATVTLPIEGLDDNGQTGAIEADGGVTQDADPTFKADGGVSAPDVGVTLGGRWRQPGRRGRHPYPSVEVPSVSAGHQLGGSVADTTCDNLEQQSEDFSSLSDGARARAQLRARMGWRPPERAGSG
jgi:hypothetical protein